MEEAVLLAISPRAILVNRYHCDSYLYADCGAIRYAGQVPRDAARARRDDRTTRHPVALHDSDWVYEPGPRAGAALRARLRAAAIRWRHLGHITNIMRRLAWELCGYSAGVRLAALVDYHTDARLDRRTDPMETMLLAAQSRDDVRALLAAGARPPRSVELSGGALCDWLADGPANGPAGGLADGPANGPSTTGSHPGGPSATGSRPGGALVVPPPGGRLPGALVDFITVRVDAPLWDRAPWVAARLLRGPGRRLLQPDDISRLARACWTRLLGIGQPVRYAGSGTLFAGDLMRLSAVVSDILAGPAQNSAQTV